MYADDIILIAPSVTELEKMLHSLCVKMNCVTSTCPSIIKSCYMRIGARCNAKCENIVSLSGQCKGVRCPPIFSLSNLINVGWL